MNQSNSEMEFVDACRKVGEALGLLLVIKLASADNTEALRTEKDNLLTRKEAASRMNVSVSTFDAWRRQGLIKPIEGLGERTVRYRESDLEKLIEQKWKQ